MSDLIIRGGYVIDPSQHLEGTMDIEIRGRRIKRLAPHIEPGGGSSPRAWWTSTATISRESATTG